MKNKYQDILTILENKQKIQIRKNSSYFVVKIGKEDMKHFDKKAEPAYFKDQQGIKDHLRQKCSLFSLDYSRIENQLNKALKPQSGGDIPTSDEPMVENGGILQKVQKWLSLKTEQVYKMQ